ncbi:hypothetical protein [Modicisalibacter xianhensis]|uniref:Uncharacterized protein n=1 Tax=Modicisalibacter xianhensis TaxID=442341 RepID=A0A1I2ZEY1_9GAMM|nr:hypothetical protein [Halomonas xianhensis]TDX26922.1 hypothetical protein DFO67_1144 [Halomonas xianhensis]SFH36398.1 hypothetical protein SAMN04487959_10382 [Halomonas xianhensis]
MNYWILAIVCYLIAVLCVFAFVRGASERQDRNTEAKSRRKQVALGQCRLKKIKA